MLPIAYIVDDGCRNSGKLLQLRKSEPVRSAPRVCVVPVQGLLVVPPNVSCWEPHETRGVSIAGGAGMHDSSDDRFISGERELYIPYPAPPVRRENLP